MNTNDYKKAAEKLTEFNNTAYLRHVRIMCVAKRIFSKEHIRLIIDKI